MGTEPKRRPGRDPDRRPTRVAIAGARTVPARAALRLLDFLLTLDRPLVLLRLAREDDPRRPNEFEFALRIVCSVVGIPIRYCVPEEGGREQVFFRDIEMVAAADVVLCVFNEAHPMEGGTAHLVEKAQDRTVPVYAYVYVTETGHLARLGEWDPDNAWGERVPHA